jgi:hypothetical protein
MKHWHYVVLRESCKIRIAFKYLGSGDSRPESLPQVESAVFSLTCDTCGKLGHYTPGDIEVHPSDRQLCSVDLNADGMETPT